MQQGVETGRREFRAAFWSARGHFIAAGVFSFFVNLLMLTGPLFMLQVYDRVLASGSIPTLGALFGLIAMLFLAMGLLDHLRARILATAGARFQALLDGRVFEATLRRAVHPADRAKPSAAMRDLEAIQQFLSGPAPVAFFDAPWMPLYVAIVFTFHPFLGLFAVAATLLLVSIAILNQMLSGAPEQTARTLSAEAEKLSESLRAEGETVRALGMGENAAQRWGDLRGKALAAQMHQSGIAGLFQTLSKTLRLFLQSAILALGAWLAVKQEISPGVMIASSIMMGRALAPVDQVIAQWRAFGRARQGARALSEFLTALPAEAERTALPAPASRLSVRGFTIAAPGERTPILRNLTFGVSPGEALGVIGPSASGKSTLARALTGIWPGLAGEIRIDGTTHTQWDPAVLGRHFGYLPQNVGLFVGTVAQNIARFIPEAESHAIVEAAMRAGAHETILKLAQGYDTDIGEAGARLSGGQRQRIGLARALFGDPAILVFDEPNANLDAEGEEALVRAIRDAKARGAAVVIMAHRPSAIAACDTLLMLRDGAQVTVGPRDEVLRKVTRARTGVVPASRPSAPSGAAGAVPEPASPREARA